MLLKWHTEHKVPLYIMRYEDMVLNKEQVLEGVFEYLLKVESIKGLNVEKRIKETLAGGEDKNTTYDIKSKGGAALNKNEFRFSPKLKAKMHEILKEVVYFYGYVEHPEKENPTGFFKYDKHDVADLKQYEAFKEVNKESMKYLLSHPDEIEKLDFVINDPSKE